MNAQLRDFKETLNFLDDYKLPQKAYHILRLAIRDLVLQPGSMILEREITDALEMSRTPVREALVRLETDGMVTLVPRRGFYVEPVSQIELKEIYQIIESLDGLAIEIAVKYITSEQIEALNDIIKEQEKALNNNDLKAWSILDDSFHAKIVHFSNQKRLISVLESFADQSYRARLYTINNRPLPYKSIIEHKAIVACMLANDAAAAKAVMQTHRRRAQQEILMALENMDVSKG